MTQMIKSVSKEQTPSLRKPVFQATGLAGARLVSHMCRNHERHFCSKIIQLKQSAGPLFP